MEILLKLVSTAATVAGICIAYQGLQTWRAQLIGRTEYDLARRLLRGVLEVREQIAAVRGPFMSAAEMVAALKEEKKGAEPNLLDDGQRKAATGLAYERRWRGIGDALANLRPDLLEAEVLWGQPVKAASKALLACVGELNAALTMYFRTLDNPSAQRQLGDRFNEYFAVVYQVSDDPTKDPFTAKVTAAVGEFEKLLRPFVTFNSAARIQTRDLAPRQGVIAAKKDALE